MNKKTFTQLHANGELELLAAITVRVNEVDNIEKTLDATVKRADGVYHVRWWLGDSPIEGRYWETTDGGWKQFERVADARRKFNTIAREVQ